MVLSNGNDVPPLHNVKKLLYYKKEGEIGMKVTSLIENTGQQEGLYTEHGLSLYLETEHHRVLFDTGASERFADNAEKLGIRLADVDLLVLSHGHYDHTGGIGRFFEENDHGKAYIQATAFSPYYGFSDGEPQFIGIQSVSKDHPRLTLLRDSYVIDEELTLFTGVTGRRCFPNPNLHLKCYCNQQFVQDDFRHEQYLAVREGDKQLLLSGCSHNGIVNILDKYQERFHRLPDVVVGGFHTAGKEAFREENAGQLQEMAEILKQMDTVFYTCHCTGIEPYLRLKEQVGDQIRYLSTGQEIVI